jgi:hypothetical protein
MGKTASSSMPGVGDENGFTRTPAPLANRTNQSSNTKSSTSKPGDVVLFVQSYDEDFIKSLPGFTPVTP